MKSYLTRIALLLPLAVAAAGCQAGETPDGPPAEPPACYDASPDVYQLIAENASFRVIAASWDPGQRDDWHEHPPLAAYFLTDVDGKLHYPDGSSKAVKGSAGEVKLLAEGEVHYFEHVGAEECRMVLIERTHGGDVPAMPEGSKPPCYEVSADVYKVLGENDGLRVILGTWEPGKRDEWHSHPPLAAYAVTSTKGMLHYDGADSKNVTIEQGQVKLIAEPESHAFENAGDSECRILIIELK
jgi:quercetin dioxygenase-like cupin family protein